jgi:hypothetical protein
MQIINVLSPSPLGEGFRVRWISRNGAVGELIRLTKGKNNA